ncbi:MAG: glycosyltransferase [Chitinophagaceae bacterium]
MTKIKQENRWLKQFLQQHRPDIIISDNRFGFYSKQVPSFFITHQLYIQTGLGSWANKIAQQFNYRQITHFSSCWVPDNHGVDALAGRLSNPESLPPIPVQYLGPLSRMQACIAPNTGIPLLIILSGPEPQRSIFESILLSALQTVSVPTIIIRGLTGTATPANIPAHVTIYDHVKASELNQLICAAEMIISRAGYTTIMDVLKLGKKIILVPTPGQAEQEYVAHWLHSRQLAYAVEQSHFDLQHALEAAKAFTFTKAIYHQEAYKTVLQTVIETITKKSGATLSTE